MTVIFVSDWRFSSQLGEYWTLLSACLLLGSAFRALRSYQVVRPHGILVSGYATAIGHCITSFIFMFSSVRLGDTAYKRAKGQPFAIPVDGHFHIFVSDPKRRQELEAASPEQLSLNEFIVDILSTRYTLNGYDIDRTDPTNKTESRVLLGGLRPNLINLRHLFESTIERQLHVSCRPSNWYKANNGVSLALLGRAIGGALNCLAIFGEEFVADQANIDASVRYAHDAAVTADMLKFTPGILRPVVGYLGMKWSGASDKFMSSIRDIVIPRLEADARGAPKRHDGVQWVMESLQRKGICTVDLLTKRLATLLFAASFTAPHYLAFALYELANHPEYLEPLREEVLSVSADIALGTTKHDMPLMDSFLKETARTIPLSMITVDRKVMHQFTFSDGLHIPAGNVLCVPEYSILQNPTNYTDPEIFDGFRFIQRTSDGRPVSASRFSHPSAKFPFWGSPKRACPGRFYVSAISKILLSHVIKEYDIKLCDPSVKPYILWGPHFVPNPRLKITLCRKTIEKNA